MSDFGAALFGGAAAQATNDSLMKWRQLWQADEDRKQRAQLLEDQQRFELQQQSGQQAFEARLAKARETFEMGLFDKEQAAELGIYTADHIGSMDTQGQQAALDFLRESRNPYLSVAAGNVRNSLFQNPMQAMDYLNGIMNTPLGTRINTDYLGMALNAARGYGDMSDEEFAEFSASYLDFAEARNSGAEEIDTNAIIASGLKLDEIRAGITQTEAETEHISASTAAVVQGMDIAEEQRPIILRNLERQGEMLDADIEGRGLENVQQGIINGFLPANLQAQLDRTLGEIRGMDDSHLLFTRTLNYTVGLLQAQTGMAQEDLRFAVATSDTRQQLINLEADNKEATTEHIRATIGWLDQQAEESDARIASMEDATLSRQQERKEGKIGILMELVKAGQPGMIQELAADLLPGLGLDPTQWATVTNELVGIASSNRSNTDKLEEANITLATYEADYAEATHEARVDTAFAQARAAGAGADLAEWEASTAQHRMEFAEEMARAGLAVDQGHLAVAQRNAKANEIAANARAAEGAKSSTPTDLLNEARTASGIDSGEIHDGVSAWQDIQADRQQLEAAITSGSSAEISALSTEYGFSPDNLEAGVAKLQRREDAARAEVIANITSVLSQGFVGGGGYIFSPQELGLSGAMLPLYNQAIEEAGFAREMSPEEQAARESNPANAEQISDIFTFIVERGKDYAEVVGPDGVSFTAASTVYDQVLAKYGDDALEAAGIVNPASINEVIQGEVLRYYQHDATANSVVEREAARTGVPAESMDLSDPQVADNLRSTSMALGHGYQDFSRNVLANLPDKGTDFMADFGLGRWRTPQHGQAAQQLINLVNGVMTPEELAQAGVIDIKFGVVEPYLNVPAAQELLATLATQRFNEAASIRYIHDDLTTR